MWIVLNCFGIFRSLVLPSLYTVNLFLYMGQLFSNSGKELRFPQILALFLNTLVIFKHDDYNIELGT